MDAQKFALEYVSSLKKLLDEIDANTISKIITEIENCAKEKARFFVIGNGGSAATVSHMANDWGPGLKRRNIINLDIISLADNTAITTALANDIGYENVFHEQLRNNITAKDILLAVSCSGNSPNIVKAVELAKQAGATVIGCTGFGGGKLKEISDIKFHVQTAKDEYGLVEDMHMILDHLIYTYFVKRG